MNSYIATFFSHFAAVRFARACRADGLRAEPAPVPRSLSSDCGTCVRYEAESPFPSDFSRRDIEQIVRVLPDGYEPVYRAEELP